MENLGFWDFVSIAMVGFISFCCYYIVAAGHYFLTVFFGGQIKKIIEKVGGKDNNNLFMTALPFCISALIIFITIVRFIGLYTEVLSDVPYLHFIVDAHKGYLTGCIPYTIGLTCLSLTRYSFTTDWKKIGVLNNKGILFNFLIWTTCGLVFTVLFKNFVHGLILFKGGYSVSIILTTYALLKWRNISRPTKNKQME